jgi:hypothetical protein
MGLARLGADGRFGITGAGTARHAREILKLDAAG